MTSHLKFQFCSLKLSLVVLCRLSDLIDKQNSFESTVTILLQQKQTFKKLKQSFNNTHLLPQCLCLIAY